MIASVALAALLLGVPVDSRPKVPDAALPAGEPPLSVYRLKLAVDIPVIVAGTAVNIATRFVFKDELARYSCPCDPSRINAFDRGSVGNDNQSMSVVSDVTAALAIGVPPILDFFDLGLGPAFGEDFTVFAETMIVNGTLEQVFNFGVARPRPRAYVGDPAYIKNPDAYLSFYSGHVAYTFAALTVLSVTVRYRYGEQVWPWVVTGLVGTSAAVERVLAGAHFPTDVIAAALVGTGLGIAIPWLHARAPAERFSILPADGGHGLLLAGAF